MECDGCKKNEEMGDCMKIRLTIECYRFVMEKDERYISSLGIVSNGKQYSLYGGLLMDLFNKKKNINRWKKLAEVC